ncbi:DUF4166 domain-containing protein [Albibacillus kandeliae]|uniref:DUF4166 domain-containing protein n=1 Tax=Albibacillus kandeliae TaxID=2174228 RepID=UPI0013004A91|nr:DUF4166 domain-containing protein [Albibacillus kandeliae]
MTSPLFERALGSETFAALPPNLRALHDVTGVRVWRGLADVERGTSLIARTAGRLFGLPPAASGMAVTVTMTSDGEGETWQRQFGTFSLQSRLGLAGPPGSGLIWERMGPVRATVPLALTGQGLGWPISSIRLLGLPLPRALLPRSEVTESDRDGKAWFDVKLTLPVGGLLVRYRGWLEPLR